MFDSYLIIWVLNLLCWGNLNLSLVLFKLLLIQVQSKLIFSLELVLRNLNFLPIFFELTFAFTISRIVSRMKPLSVVLALTTMLNIKSSLIPKNLKKSDANKALSKDSKPKRNPNWKNPLKSALKSLERSLDLEHLRILLLLWQILLFKLCFMIRIEFRYIWINKSFWSFDCCKIGAHPLLLILVIRVPAIFRAHEISYRIYDSIIN